MSEAKHKYLRTIGSPHFYVCKVHKESHITWVSEDDVVHAHSFPVNKIKETKTELVLLSGRNLIEIDPTTVG